MGKSRRNRAASVRANPLAASASASAATTSPKPVKPPADPALAKLRESAVLPVVRDLRSADPAKRSLAAGAIASLVANDTDDGRVRKLLLREQVVHVVLTETLTDARIESRAAGWAVLAVLALHEAPDFCVHLYRCDVLTPAGNALTQVVDVVFASGASSKAETKLAWHVAAAVVDLVGQLASARDEILDAVLANAAIGRGLAALATGVVPGTTTTTTTTTTKVTPDHDVQWAALSRLGRLLEGGDERPVAARKPQQALARSLVEDGAVYGALRGLVAGADGDGDDGSLASLAVAAAFLLHTVYAALEWFDASPGPDGESDAVLVGTLAGVLGGAQGDGKDGKDADVYSLALQTLAMMGTTLSRALEKGNAAEAVWDGIQDDDGNELTLGEEEDDDDDDDGEDRDMTDAAPRKANGHSGEGMDVDMEVDADGDDNDDDNDDDDNDDNSSSSDMVDIEHDMEAVTGADDAAAPGLEDMPTLQALLTVALPQTMAWVEARGVDSAAADDDDPLLLDGLAVLNNCAWTLSCLDAEDGGNATLLQAWAPTAAAIWQRVVRPLLKGVVKAKANAESDLADPVAALAWAVARVLRGATPVAGEVDDFLQLYALSHSPSAANPQSDPHDDPLQSLSVKCVGVLGQLALGADAPLDRNRAVGRFLVGLVAGLPATPAHEAVEALDQVFEVYGDETAACDEAVFWAEDFLGTLEAATPAVKAMAKKVDKRAQGELRARADEAVLNLRRFVQYKKRVGKGGKGGKGGR